ncbi:MAG: type II toxin-antitoxin system PemK/MazF family toxin [Flavobacteriaceae bacterium]
MYSQGDIVWIDWGYIDKKNPNETKPRPCLVISNNDCHNSDSADLILCPFTSNTRLNKFCYLIDNKDLSRSLQKFSELRANKIFTYSSSKVLSKHGEIINPEVLNKIIELVNSAIKIS